MASVLLFCLRMTPLKSFQDRTADYLRAVLLVLAALFVVKIIPGVLHTWRLEYGYAHRTPPSAVATATWAIGVLVALSMLGLAYFSVRQRPVPGYAYPARKLNILQELIIAGVGAAMLVGVGFALFSLPIAAAPAQSHRSDLAAIIFLIAMFLPAGFACLCWRPVYVVDPVGKTLTHYRIARFLGVTRQLPFEFTIQAIRYRRQYGYVWAIMHQAKKCEFLVDFLDYGRNSQQVVDAYAVTVNQALHGQPSFEPIAPAPSSPAPATAVAPHRPFTPSHYPR